MYSILYSVLSIIHHENSVSDLTEDQWASETEDCQSVGYACQVVLGVMDTLWLFNIAMENGPCIDDFPSYKPPFTRDFPWLC